VGAPDVELVVVAAARQLPVVRRPLHPAHLHGATHLFRTLHLTDESVGPFVASTCLRAVARELVGIVLGGADVALQDGAVPRARAQQVAAPRHRPYPQPMALHPPHPARATLPSL
jgi:hypothetical protein